MVEKEGGERREERDLVTQIIFHYSDVAEYFFSPSKEEILIISISTYDSLISPQNYID